METFAAGGGEGGYGGTSSVGGRAVWGDLWQGDGTWKQGAQRGREGKAGKSEEAGDGSVRRFPRVQNKPAGICSSYFFARHPSHLFWKEYVGGCVPSDSGKRGGFSSRL